MKRNTKSIKLFDPTIGFREEQLLLDTLRSHYWASGAGTNLVYAFEEKFKKYVNAKECVAVNSGTAALNLALSMYDIKGKEVILPSMTFVATANAVIMNGGKPVFVDIDEDTLNLNLEDIKSAISKKTKIILPVHFGGLSCDMEGIQSLARKNNLKIIEDAAHATGSKYKNSKIGSHGHVVCFSFHPVKNLAMPTGGLIAINEKNSKKIRKELLAKRWCGITNRKGTDYDVKEIGNNYYMNEFSASIGIIQLKKLDRLNTIRKTIAKRFSSELNLQTKSKFDKNCSYHLYWIIVKNRDDSTEWVSNGSVLGNYTRLHPNANSAAATGQGRYSLSKAGQQPSARFAAAFNSDTGAAEPFG